MLSAMTYAYSIADRRGSQPANEPESAACSLAAAGNGARGGNEKGALGFSLRVVSKRF